MSRGLFNYNFNFILQLITRLFNLWNYQDCRWCGLQRTLNGSKVQNIIFKHQSQLVYNYCLFINLFLIYYSWIKKVWVMHGCWFCIASGPLKLHQLDKSNCFFSLYDIVFPFSTMAICQGQPLKIKLFVLRNLQSNAPPVCALRCTTGLYNWVYVSCCF